LTRVQRVVMLTNAVAPDKLGGLERYVRELAAALVATGTPVTVLCKRVGVDDPPVEVGDDGVRIVRHDVPSKRDPRFGLRYPLAVRAAVRAALADAGPDVVLHGHFSVTSLEPALSRRSYVHTFHAPVYKELLSERQDSYVLPRPLQPLAVAALRAAEAKVMREAARVLVLSEFMRDELAALSPAAAESAVVVAGGIDTDHFRPGPVTPHGWADAAAPLLVVARRLTPRTGVSELVEAMPAVLAELPTARLAILGDGGQRDAVAARIRALGLGESVQLQGRVSEDELVQWYRRATLVVMPTQQLEGFGLTTAEAMACGTVVVATPIGANPEVVSRLDPSLLARGSSPADIASVIVRVCRGTELLARLRLLARDAVHPHMSWTAIAEQHLALYRELT